LGGKILPKETNLYLQKLKGPSELEHQPKKPQKSCPDSIALQTGRILPQVIATFLKIMNGISILYDLCLLYAVPNVLYEYTVKKVSGFPVPSRDVTYQTLPCREFRKNRYPFLQCTYVLHSLNVILHSKKNSEPMLSN
jgi:hypothetical protein